MRAVFSPCRRFWIGFQTTKDFPTRGREMEKRRGTIQFYSPDRGGNPRLFEHQPTSGGVKTAVKTTGLSEKVSRRAASE
jgi:hypothetical protein